MFHQDYSSEVWHGARLQPPVLCSYSRWSQPQHQSHLKREGHPHFFHFPQDQARTLPLWWELSCCRLCVLSLGWFSLCATTYMTPFIFWLLFYVLAWKLTYHKKCIVQTFCVAQLLVWKYYGFVVCVRHKLSPFNALLSPVLQPSPLSVTVRELPRHLRPLHHLPPHYLVAMLTQPGWRRSMCTRCTTPLPPTSAVLATPPGLVFATSCRHSQLPACWRMLAVETGNIWVSTQRWLQWVSSCFVIISVILWYLSDPCWDISFFHFSFIANATWLIMTVKCQRGFYK